MSGIHRNAGAAEDGMKCRFDATYPVSFNLQHKTFEASQKEHQMKNQLAFTKPCTLLACTATVLFTNMSAAHATASISCSGIDRNIAVDIIFGAGPVANVLDVTVGTDKQNISTRTGFRGTPAVLVRSFTDAEELKIYLMDDEAIEHLVSIRILRFDNQKDEPFQIGYVRVGNETPSGILCDGP